MNTEKARQILTTVILDETSVAEYNEARGYIEAITKAELLENYIRGMDCHCSYALDVRCKRCRVLKIWDKEK